MDFSDDQMEMLGFGSGFSINFSLILTSSSQKDKAVASVVTELLQLAYID